MSWRVTNRRGVLREHGVMFSLMLLMTLIHAGQFVLSREWELTFMMIPAEVVRSWNSIFAGSFGLEELWVFATTFTCAFLHGDPGHLVSNMLFFWIFGALLHELLGWRWLLGLVAATAVGGSIIHTAMNPESWIPTIGASGIVSGFMGAYFGMSVRWQLPFPQIWPMSSPVPPANMAIIALIYVGMDYMMIFDGARDMTAYGAHVGGFTAGLFMACFLVPMPRLATPRI